MNFIKGNYIGRGRSRKIFECKNFPDQIIKKRSRSRPNGHIIDENYMEYLNYKNLSKMNMHHWIAPCKYLSNKNLLMKKIISLPKEKYFIPKIFSKSRKNWGLLNNNLVCIDYDFLILPNSPIFYNKSKKIKSKTNCLYVFRDHLIYLNQIQKKYNIKKFPFTYKLIKNKFFLKKLFKKELMDRKNV